MSATRSPMETFSMGTADWSGVRARVWKPRARSSASPSYQLAMRAYGTANTAPIETLTDLLYSGSAHRGERITASTPRAAAHLKIAPTLPWSTRSSRTRILRGGPCPSRVFTDGSSSRAMDARAPRWTAKPAMPSITSSETR